MKISVSILCASLAIGAISCGGDRTEPGSSDTMTADTIAPGTATAETTGVVTPPADTAATSGDWTVAPTGFGPIRYGMTVAEARLIAGGSAAGDTGECFYLSGPNLPDRTSLMIVGGQVTRVNVMTRSAVASDAGGRIGDTEERIKSLYPSRVKVEPHKYVESGHYLIVPSEDGTKAIVFETDGKKVTTFRGGRMPEVTWVEGCS